MSAGRRSQRAQKRGRGASVLPKAGSGAAPSQPGGRGTSRPQSSSRAAGAGAASRGAAVPGAQTARRGGKASALLWNAPAGSLPASERVFTIGFGIVAAAFAVVTLAFIFGPHKLGDYMTETDFYGAYAQGARLVQHGTLDPSRFGVIGPGYEVALGLFGFVIPDLFLAAELLSLIAALVILWAWFQLLRRHVNAAAGCFAALFMATNAHFLRHAYSATTDAFAIALQAMALWMLLSPGAVEAHPAPAGSPPAAGAGDEHRATAGDPAAAPSLGGLLRVLAAGLVAAFAFLTRYNSICLLAAGVAAIAGGAARVTPRTRGALLFVAGFCAPVVPWILYSLSHGGSFSFQLHHNIAYEVFARARGIPWDDYQKLLQPQFHNLWDVIARDPKAVFARMAFNVWDHLRLDATNLLTVPVAVTCLFGVVFARRDGTLRMLWPVWLTGILLFLTLVPVFYSERYALALLPMYASLSGLALASPVAAMAVGRRLWLKPALAVIPLTFAVLASVKVQARVVDQLPTEVLTAAETLRKLARPGDRVIARKGHIAYHAGIEPLGFPFSDSLPQLASYARKNHARWLYFSWPEAETRPRLWYLLDSTAVVPGLTPRVVTHPHPAVLYEIGPGFGQQPWWLANDTLRTYHTLRAELSVDAGDPKLLFQFAVVSRSIGKLDECRIVLEALLRMRPLDTRALTLLGDVLLVQKRPDLADPVFGRLMTADPSNPLGGIGRGWALLMQNRREEAAQLWQPRIEATRDPLTLDQMIALFASLGDHDSEARARARLAQLPAAP